MLSFKRTIAILLVLLQCGYAVAGDGHVIGFGVEGDTTDSLVFSAFGDFGITEKTWVSVTAAKAQAEGLTGELDTVYGEIGLDHYFGPVGVRLGTAYWGDDEILDSFDIRGSFYVRTEAVSVSMDYEKRDFDFIFTLGLLSERRQVGFEADGFGLSFRAKTGERTGLFIRGMAYDYSVDLTQLQNISDLRFLAASRLSLANSLLEHRVDAGIDFKFGLKQLSLEVGSRQTAVDGGRVDSISVGFLFPASDASDIELRVGYDDADSFGGTTVISFFWFFYGS